MTQLTHKNEPASAETAWGEPETQTYLLPNGLTVVLQKDARTPNAHVHVAYRVGTRDEGIDESGFTELALAMLYQGSTHAPGSTWQRLERAGATSAPDASGVRGIDATVDEDRVVLYATFPASSLENMLWLESDRMGFTADALDDQNLSRERQALLTRRAQRRSSPPLARRELVARLMHEGDHPYLPRVSDQSVAQATKDQIASYLRRHFTPDNAIVTISGAIEVEAALALVQKYFGPLPAGSPRTRPTSVPVSLTTTRSFIDETPLTASLIGFYWPAPASFAPDEYPLKTLAAIMERRLANQFAKQDEKAPRYRVELEDRELSGTFALELSAFDQNATQEAARFALAELQRIAREAPSAIELNDSKGRLALKLADDLERVAGENGRADRASRVAAARRLGIDPGNPAARLAAVDAERVRQVAQAWLQNKPHVELRQLPRKLVAPATQAQIDRKEEPSLAGRVPFNVPPLTSKTLDNGMIVNVVSREDQPRIDVSFSLHTGEQNETAASAGISHLTTAIIASSPDATKLEESLAKLTSPFRSEGGKYGSTLSLSVFAEQIESAVDLLTKLVRKPEFNQDALESIRAAQLAAQKQERARPDALASQLTTYILFAGTPHALSDGGNEASLAEIKSSDLERHYQKWWVPNNASLTFVGNITLEKAEALAAKHFGNWSSREIDPSSKPAAAPNIKSYTFLVDRPTSPDVIIRLAGHAPARYAKDHHAAHIVTSLLGDGNESRLMQHLQKAQIRATNIFAKLVQNQSLGYWEASATVSPDLAPAALIAMRQAVISLSGAPGEAHTQSVSSEELGRAQKTLTRHFFNQFERRASIMRLITPTTAESTIQHQLNDHMVQILTKSPADIEAAARQYFAAGTSIHLLVGPTENAEKNLGNLGIGEAMVLDEAGKVLRQANAPQPHIGAGTPAEPSSAEAPQSLGEASEKPATEAPNTSDAAAPQQNDQTAIPSTPPAASTAKDTP